MNVGRASERAGLPVRTMHYYEEIGLVVPARRENGYRDYSEADVHKLGFLQRARGLGFSVEECRTLLTLYEDRNRASAAGGAARKNGLIVTARPFAPMTPSPGASPVNLPVA